MLAFDGKKSCPFLKIFPSVETVFRAIQLLEGSMVFPDPKIKGEGWRPSFLYTVLMKLVYKMTPAVPQCLYKLHVKQTTLSKMRSL